MLIDNTRINYPQLNITKDEALNLIACLVEGLQVLERRTNTPETTFKKPTYIQDGEKHYPGVLTILVSK